MTRTKTEVTTQTQIGIELDDNNKRLHKRAVVEETKWREAHGIDDKLRTKRQRKVKVKWKPLSRKEAECREQRRRQWIERQALRLPLLKGV